MTVSMKTAAVPELRKTICSSAIFQAAMAQEHHYDTTLGRHSVLVYRQALRICKALEKKRDHDRPQMHHCGISLS